MTERTEEQKLMQASLQVVLGGKEYDVAPLKLKDSRAWRSLFTELVIDMQSASVVEASKPEEFNEAIKGLMVSQPDKVVDLFFKYAKDLPRDTIEEEATDAEVSLAFEGVVQMAFPLVTAMGKAVMKVSA